MMVQFYYKYEKELENLWRWGAIITYLSNYATSILIFELFTVFPLIHIRRLLLRTNDNYYNKALKEKPVFPPLLRPVHTCAVCYVVKTTHNQQAVWLTAHDLSFAHLTF